MARKTYSPQFKFQVVLESLTSDRTDTEIARAYDIHPVTLGKWRSIFKDNGAKVFGGDDVIQDYEKRIAELERLLGKKEVEIALLKNFLGGS